MAAAPASARSGGVERHEWRERTSEVLRYFRAEYHAGRWTIRSRVAGEDEWMRHDPPDLELWGRLRDVLWRKYQRRRCPWKLVEGIDRLLAAAAPEPGSSPPQAPEEQ